MDINRMFEDMRLAVEKTNLLSLGDGRADAVRSIEGRYSRAAGTTTLHRDALRNQLDAQSPDMI